MPGCCRVLLSLAASTMVSTAAMAQKGSVDTTECGALAGLPLPLTLPKITFTVAQSVSGGSFTPPGATTPFTDLPNFCRIAGNLTPTSDSVIGFELWLPDSWNKRYQQVGNGGFGQGIQYPRMVTALTQGYATASTDDGNQTSTTGSDGAAFALGHPQKIIDFGYRAVHLTAQVAKVITSAYYAQRPSFTYFNGCSEGGREALVEAQRFPDDFDGILAGAPAQDFLNQQAAGIWNEQALYLDPASTIPVSKTPAIQAAALAACDTAGDNVADGVIGDERACRFDPSVLLCTGAESDSCLTAPQVKALKLAYEGAHDPQTGQRIYVGAQPGTEAFPSGNNFISAFLSGLTAAQPSSGNTVYKNFVFMDPNFDWRTFDITEGLAFAYHQRAAGQLLSRILVATNPDLSAFQARGGKLIHYHGWNDYYVLPYSPIYYENVLTRADATNRAAALSKIQSFYRLYMVPGMQHCHGGPGAVSFGQTSPLIQAASDTTPLTEDPQHDILLAIRAWVEDGVAPEHLVAASYNGNNAANGLRFTRPLCPYPQTATYTGSGDTNDAANFVCADLHLTLNDNIGLTPKPNLDHP
jgi:hypothetical protein